jgi:cytochrome b561
MNSDPRPLRYSPVAMAFHWVIATLILADFFLAESFSRFNPGDTLYFSWAYSAHMSTGMAIIVLATGRLAWRAAHKYPDLPPDTNPLARILAKAAHALLYVYMLAAPVSGWVVLSVRKKPPVFVGTLHWPNISYLADMTRAQRAVIHDVFLPGHILFSFVGLGLVVLHVAAALYHHYWRNDDVLRRMLPRPTIKPIADSVRT